MKVLLATIICLTISMNSHFTKTNTLEQSFEVAPHITTLRTDLNGNTIEWIKWSQPGIKVETHISSNLEDTYGVAYSLRRGHYELKAFIDGPRTLALRSKKINTQIFMRGKEQKLKASYRIYIPETLELAD